MDTELIAIVLLAAFVCAWAAWEVTRALRTSRQVRGPRVVTCPETGRPASVTLDVRHAVASSLVAHAPQLRLQSCSRWIERGRCDEPCLCEAAAPASSARAIVEREVKGKRCAFCGKRIERVAFLNHHVALLQPDQTTIEWRHVAPERLRDSLVAQLPVCWDCHVAESFRRQYPELVTDRPWPRA
jgi:hypothetical protein